MEGLDACEAHSFVELFSFSALCRNCLVRILKRECVLRHLVETLFRTVCPNVDRWFATLAHLIGLALLARLHEDAHAGGGVSASRLRSCRTFSTGVFRYSCAHASNSGGFRDCLCFRGISKSFKSFGFTKTDDVSIG